MLGDGQQVVVAGTHPDTGSHYAWRWGHSPVTISRDKLPLIDEHEAHSIVDECVDELLQLGWTLAGGSSGTSPGAETDNVVPPRTPIAERVEKMQYGGEFPINDTLLAYSGDQLRNGVTCESVIKDCLARAQKAYEIFPAIHKSARYGIGRRCATRSTRWFMAISKRTTRTNLASSRRFQPDAGEVAQDREAGGAPTFRKRRFWGVEDTGPADSCR